MKPETTIVDELRSHLRMLNTLRRNTIRYAVIATAALGVVALAAAACLGAPALLYVPVVYGAWVFFYIQPHLQDLKEKRREWSEALERWERSR